MMSPSKEIACSFLAEHLARNPEEAGTLGLPGYAAQLGDPSPTARAEELVAARRWLRAAEGALPGEDDPSGRLDLDAVVRAAGFVVRTVETDADAGNLELSMLPHAALQHGALHAELSSDWAALAARAAEVPRFLAAHGENLRRGARDGRAPDRECVAVFVDRLIPGAAEALDLLAAEAKRRGAPEPEARAIDRAAREASAAYRRFGALVTEALVPTARDHVRLGEGEVRRRLREVMGLARSLEELRAFARESLRAAHEALARALGHELLGAANVQSAQSAIAAALAPRPTSLGAVLDLYAGHTEAATALVRERDLLPLPPLALSYEPLPEAIADGGAVTNWPAPLADARARGHVLYARDVAAHPLVATKNLAVHEGIPGHYLQSAAWQRALAEGRLGPECMVRFLGVADPIAMSRGYFGAMTSVEGWAVHMEQLLHREGFYDEGPETLFFAVCDAIRAARVALDLDLHAGDHSDAALVDDVARATFLPEPWARAQVLRAKRLPLQGLTYAVGEAEIAALREREKGREAKALYGELLAKGPVPASRL